MLLYIAPTNRVVSVVVVVEREEEGKTMQRPVYCLSEVLSLSKQNYPHFQKMTYVMFMAATKLKHYFEEHPMKVVSEAPISDIMCNKDASDRIAKWAIQLSPYVPVYERRDAIKSQALADFLVDWAEMQYKPPEQKIEYWKMHFDGSKLKEGLSAGVVLTSPKGDHLRYVLQVHFRASNNVAEYEALIHGLKVAKEIGAHQIICYGDSDLVVQQCSADWDAKDANMASYRFHVQKIAGFFEGCEFHHVPRAENEAADALSKLGSSRQEIPPGIALAHLRIPSIKPSPESESIFVPESHVVPMDVDEGNPRTVPVNPGTAVSIPEEAMLVDNMEIDVPVFLVREAPSWVKPIKEFLINDTLPVDENESRRIQRRSKAYTIINGEVYKRSVTGVLQRCVEPEEGKEMLVEIHQGECGHHASSRALVAKVFRHGFYCPPPENARIWYGNATGARDKTLLDTSCSGSFTRNKEEFKRDLLDRIQENTEGWENDKDRESCVSIALAPNNPLQQHLEDSESEVFREERNELDEIFLRQPILKHDLSVEDLGTTPPPKEDPVFDLKPLPDNLKYAHIDDKKIYPVIISSKLSDFEEERLLEVLKKHRGAIGYNLDYLKGISPSICQHAINMEDDAKPVVEHQRHLIPKMKDVVRNEVLKLLEAGIIYPIADIRWVSPVHCVPKKGGMTVVPNDNDEIIPQRVVVGGNSEAFIKGQIDSSAEFDFE
ncbi:hypothetical protein QYE76_068877 [Lolium multiflorum]|uniref:RNase H type-1 domain-containing protein n=1 Tax=Lolium multiflorum TaxID=4521 RepID=A0AAD8SH52_LOLMU|nr:hypothetical protein QYE76_068877 [Lolium multiflorum]